MAFQPVTASDFGTFIGAEVDDARATQLIGFATSLALAVVSPLPDGAEAIVCTAVARAYSNPGQVTSETVGPYSATRPTPGLYLTKAERSSLRLLGGLGAGAFTIDPTPDGAGQNLIDALAQPTDSESFEYIEEMGY